jgi:hypothetical protein
MGTTSLDIASQALSLIRANPISSFSEGTNEAEIASLFYGTFVKDIFSRYPWAFALKKRKLNRSGDAPINEFKYNYIIPAEVERIFSVYNSGEVRARPVQNFDISQRNIQSNEEELWTQYTVYEDEANWPGYFIQYAIYAFAAMLAIPVTDDESIANTMQTTAYGTPQEQEKGGKFAIAASTDSQQKPPEQIYNNEIIGARFSHA